MHFKAMQEAPGPSVVVWIDLELGIDKGAYEPSLDSALVIGCVARAGRHRSVPCTRDGQVPATAGLQA